MSKSAGSSPCHNPQDDANSIITAPSINLEDSKPQQGQVCIYCKQEFQPLYKFNQSILAHQQCREAQGCSFCGDNFLTISCSIQDCQRVLHTWCTPIQELCAYHSKQKKASKVQLAKEMVMTLWENPQLAYELKQNYPNLCKSSVLWFLLGIEYFSQEAPVIPLVTKAPEIQANIDSSQFLGNEISKVTQQISLVNAQNAFMINQLQEQQQTPKHWQRKKFTNEDDSVLKHIINVRYRQQKLEYLRYIEQNIQDESSSVPQSSQTGLRTKPENEEDWVCEVCIDGDFSNDNLIVICGKCEMAVHMKCYGISDIPVGDWMCEPCKVFELQERHNLPCVLCNVKGGAQKSTWQLCEMYPHYQQEGYPTRVWCHVFCASRIEGVTYYGNEYMKNISLIGIDKKRFQLTCSICKTRNGACIQCNHGRCQAAFHPECAKNWFTSTKIGTDEDLSIFCGNHRSMKLRRVIEIRDKKAVSDISKFLKQLRPLAKQNSRMPMQSRELDINEQRLLRKEVKKVLARMNKKDKTPFKITISLGQSGSLRSKIHVRRPEHFNLLEPEIFKDRKITIPNRRWTECFEFYKEELIHEMRNELEIMGCPIKIFTPKRRKRPAKQRGRKPIKRVKRMPKYTRPILDYLEDVTSNEVYCICKQPYVESLGWQPEWSEEEYERRRALNAMIECQKCSEWFHIGCLKIDPANIPDSFICPSCDPKWGNIIKV